MELALIRDDTTLVEFRNLDSRPPDIPHKNLRWLPVVRTNDPFTPATEVLEPEVDTIDIPGDQYSIARAVRAKTAQEIDAPKQAEADSEMARALALVVLDEFNTTRAQLNVLRQTLTTLVANNPALDTTGLSALPDLPNRTVDQLKSAIKAKL